MFSMLCNEYTEVILYVNARIHKLLKAQRKYHDTVILIFYRGTKCMIFLIINKYSQTFNNC